MSDLAPAVLESEDLPVELRLEKHRVELTGYCYRMLGSGFDAEDAVQETMVRAWRGFDAFEGRAALRSWLYRIATNVCLDMVRGSQRRARPMDLSAAWTPVPLVDGPTPEATWLSPMPDGRALPERGDPAEVAVARETIRLAFVAALQHLAPRQRAVLLLREVLSFSASETAELLDTTVASVNSALQRARATLAAADVADSDTLAPMDEAQVALLTRYVEAFERYDLDSLTSLLHEDAVLSMPPLPMWFRGAADIAAWMLGPGQGCRGSRLIATAANGLPAFGQYRPSGPGGRHEPWALIVLEIAGGRIVGINSFLDTAQLFPMFNLPMALAG